MADHQIPDTWKTEHLIVLVGGNPLPNYIAAKVLLRDNGILHLLYSPNTAAICERLKVHFQHELHQLSDPGDGMLIETVINDLIDKVKHSGSIGLHYTGGTKAMAVHSYNALMRQLPAAICTYLDARTFRLVSPQHAESHSVQYTEKIPLSVLADLQQVPFQSEKVVKQPRFEAINQALAEAHRGNNGPDRYAEWCRDYLRSDGRQLASEQADFSQPRIPLPTAGSLQSFSEQMKSTFYLDDDTFDPAALVADQRFGFRDIEDLTHYFDGGWVENLVLQSFQAVAKECRIHETAMTIDTDVRAANAAFDFEYDVVALQGGRLFALSCTRSTQRKLCKSKLFEAYVRAMQLGGDEARVGLVCALKEADKQSLQAEIRRLWDGDNLRFRVFGRKDLPILASQLRSWLLT